MVVCGQEASKQFREQADAGHVPVAHRSQILIKSEPEVVPVPSTPRFALYNLIRYHFSHGRQDGTG